MPKMTIAANIGGKTRRDKLDGEDHLVVPAGMLAVGVWPGSDGPAYYRKPVLVNSIPTWDHKPVVVRHPQAKSGEWITACQKAVIDSRRVGVMLNTRYQGKLKTEAWINIRKCNSVDPRIIKRLERGKQIETSTGIVYKMLNRRGEYNGTKYKFEVKQMIGDHLAILPDEVGAYPVSAGGGLLANRDCPPEVRKRMADSGVAMPDGTFPIRCGADVIQAKRSLKKLGNAEKSRLRKHIRQRAEALSLLGNELSATDLSYRLGEALAERFGRKGKSWYGYVCEVYPESKYVVYYAEDGRSYGLSYTTDGDEVALSGDAVLVTPKRVYQTADGGYLGNGATAPQQKETGVMAETKTFDPRRHAKRLIANGVYKKEEFKKLLALPPEILEKIPVKGTKRQDVLTNTSSSTTEATTTTKEPKGGEDFMANLDPETKAAVEYGQKRFKRDKEVLVKKILANKENTLDEKYLRSINDLDVLAGIAKPYEILANSKKKRLANEEGPDDDDDDDGDGDAAEDFDEEADTDFSAAGGGSRLSNREEIPQLELPDYDLTVNAARVVRDKK